METAKAIINDALQEILVQASEQDIPAVDFQTARRYLNRMMAGTPFLGLGYTTIALPTDLVTIPDQAVEGVVFSLAKRLLASYDMPITTELEMNVKLGLKQIRRITVNVIPSSHPCTLPIGSGNEQENTFNNQHFYSCPGDEVLTESGGSILLEDATND